MHYKKYDGLSCVNRMEIYLKYKGFVKGYTMIKNNFIESKMFPFIYSRLFSNFTRNKSVKKFNRLTTYCLKHHTHKEEKKHWVLFCIITDRKWR